VCSVYNSACDITNNRHHLNVNTASTSYWSSARCEACTDAEGPKHRVRSDNVGILALKLAGAITTIELK